MSTNKKITPAKEKRLNLKKEIMSKIDTGQIAMKPKWYFVVGTILMTLGTIATTVGAIYLINLTMFLARGRGIGYRKVEMILSGFPFWIPILAVIGICLGIWLLKKYDFSYKKNFVLIVIGFIFSIIIAGFIIDQLGLNDVWSHRGLMKGFYQRIENQGRGSLQNGRGNGYNRN